MRDIVNIRGGFTFASAKDLTNILKQASEQALDCRCDKTFTLDIQLNFLDSQAKLLLLRLLKAFKKINDSSSNADVLVVWKSPANDCDLQEFGAVAQDITGFPFDTQTI